MCTVTYLPNGSGYILTSSRDEKVMRPSAHTPKIFSHADYTLLYPEDGLHKGTWIAVSDKHRALVLLNGGLVKHISKPPYKKAEAWFYWMHSVVWTHKIFCFAMTCLI